jgi:hypothetical protein
MARLTFWFEFASTYSYLSAMRIEKMARKADVDVIWKPFLLGPIFKAQNWDTSPFNIYPAKGRYMVRDIERIAQERGLAFCLRRALRSLVWRRDGAPPSSDPFSGWSLPSTRTSRSDRRWRQRSWLLEPPKMQSSSARSRRISRTSFGRTRTRRKRRASSARQVLQPKAVNCSGAMTGSKMLFCGADG